MRPTTGSIFVRAFLGQVNVRASTTVDRERLRDEYNKFKERTNIGARGGGGGACSPRSAGRGRTTGARPAFTHPPPPGFIVFPIIWIVWNQLCCAFLPFFFCLLESNCQFTIGLEGKHHVLN